MKKYFIFIITLFLVMFINFYCLAAQSVVEKQHPASHHQQGEKQQDLELSGKIEDGIRVIEIKASKYKFEPDPIVVRLGEKVRLVVTSTDVAHGIAISEFNVKLSVPAGKTERIEFVAYKQGEFHAYCSVYCGPGHGKMHGTLIVVSEHGHEEMPEDQSSSEETVANVENKICPVSGEKIDEKMKATYEYQGKIYNFCCTGCIEEFKKDPEKYIKKVSEELEKESEGKSDEEMMMPKSEISGGTQDSHHHGH